MDPSDLGVGGCPKNRLLSVVSGWKGLGVGFGGLLEIGSMLNFFGKSVGAGMLNFSEVALVVMIGVGWGLGMLSFVVSTDAVSDESVVEAMVGVVGAAVCAMVSGECE